MRKLLITFVYSFLLLIILSACGSNYSDKTPPKVENGVLDLSDWNFEKDGPFELSGEVEFYWKKLYHGNEPGLGTTVKPDALMTIGEKWKGKTISDGNVLEPYGYSTMRFQIKLPRSYIKSLNDPIVLKLKGWTAYQTKLFDTKGKPLVLEKNRYQVNTSREKTIGTPLFSYIALPKMQEVWVNLQNSSFLGHQGGGILSISQVGTLEQIQFLGEKRISKTMFICGFLFMVGIYHLVIFALYRKEKAPLWLAVYCFQILCFALTGNGDLSPLLYPTELSVSMSS